MMQKEFLFSGKGGQGLGVMGRILSLAAVLEEREVASSASYGGEVTGGLSQSEVIISDEKIDFPGVMNPDVMILLSQESYDKLAPGSEDKALLFCDPSLVCPGDNPVACRTFWVSSAERAIESLGRNQFANMIMLGAVIAVTGIVSPESISRIIGQEFQGKNPELNAKAFGIGHQIGSGICEHPLPEWTECLKQTDD